MEDKKENPTKKILNYKLTKDDVHRLINYATKVPQRAKELKSEVKKNILTAVLAAFGFIIALSWRDAIRSGVNEITGRVGIEGTGYIYQITTAVIVTLICVIGIMVASRVKGKEDVKK